ncbi:MAG: D-2-hydroxyacid dehydrogenase [Tissierellia bacterium]|nr:D-2-hydroxyacid dehydrogenase [Tissierellia bacterium]
MKVAVFNLREDEIKLLDNWKKDHEDIEVVAYKERLVMDMIDLVKDVDTISFSSVLGLDDEVYDALKENGIKVISQRSAGYDMYNMDKLNELGIKLINVPRYSPYAIGEYALASALYFTRNLNSIFNKVKNYDFRWQLPILAKEMRTLTVGVVGTGNIGRATAELFKGMGAKVIGYDVYQSEEAKELLEYVSLDEIYERSDVITFHVPATKDNFHMVDAQAIDKMKDSVVLINAARGSIFDTKAVLDGLNKGKIKGAALDVYENEQGIVNRDKGQEGLQDPILKEIIDREDIIYTPHIAFYTETALDNLISFALDESITFLKTGDSNSVVNR